MLSGLVLAQAGEDNSINLGVPADSGFSQLGDVTVGSLVSGAVVLVLIAASLIFFFMLVLGGIKWITSGGDKAQTEAARKQLTAALIGLAIVFSAWAIISLVGTLFGELNLLNLNFRTFLPQ